MHVEFVKQILILTDKTKWAKIYEIFYDGYIFNLVVLN